MESVCFCGRPSLKSSDRHTFQEMRIRAMGTVEGLVYSIFPILPLDIYAFDCVAVDSRPPPRYIREKGQEPPLPNETHVKCRTNQREQYPYSVTCGEKMYEKEIVGFLFSVNRGYQ